jgi:hypothetical protein
MVANANGVSSYAGTAGSGIFVWGAQLEPVTYQTTPGPYVATTASAYYGPRFDYNPLTLGALGLLIEEQRTNLLTYSEQFDNAAWQKTNVTVTTNQITAPDGTSGADKIAATASASTALLQQVASVASTTATYTIYVQRGSGDTDANSFLVRNVTTLTNLLQVTVNYATGAITYVTGSSGASMTDVGGGWWRLALTVSSGLTSGNTVNVYTCFAGATETAAEFAYSWGAQLEVGAFATSYIPTVASQVTRNTDVAAMTGTNFSDWYNQTEGTFVAEISLNNAPAVATFSLYSVSDNTANERIFVGTGFGSGGNINALVTDGGVLQAQTINGGLASAGLYKYGNAYAANDFASAANGGSVVTDASGTLPTVDRLYIGASAVGTAPINGHVRQIAYFNTRLPNAQLETLSSPSLVPTLVLDFTASSYASGY